MGFPPLVLQIIPEVASGMNQYDSVPAECPYCWENIEVEADPAMRRQEYVEDCPVFCQPIVFRITRDGANQAMVQAERENE